MFLEVNLVSFLIFVFASIGMTHILVDGSIFQSVRDAIKENCCEFVYNLFTCYQCLGFWVGLVTGLAMTFNPFGLVLCGCASSFLSYLAADYLNYLESKNY